MTGRNIGQSVQTVSALPARLTFSFPGYVTRETWIDATPATTDLIQEAGFDLAFYRQFARNAYDAPGHLQPLWVLPIAPSFYMEVEGRQGLSTQVGRQLEAVARRLVPQLTGGRWHVTHWETGPEPSPRQTGWIMIERRDDPEACGRAYVGAPDGAITLSGDTQACDRIEAVFAHELGHAFGFFHVDRAGAMMDGRDDWWQRSAADGPNEIERHHARVAYHRPRGNTDIDGDPYRLSILRSFMITD